MKAKFLPVAAFALAVTLFFYPIRFAIAFELLGSPVRSSEDGWLGPTPRDAGACVVDIGKINAWECEDTSLFFRHQHGCELWLWFFGYSDG
ncbi:hypothetical protein [Marilutibacter maris]|uniref:hypothetical protein n=1 Tax=Marilutibacter maris TaxID=1605891 RepID=UPI000DA92430|nr:hypothetical protein [Lysobacter maris]